jgi:hypothetical protein
MEFWTKILICVLSSRAVLYVLQESDLLGAPRNKLLTLLERRPYFHELVRCPFCLGFWILLIFLLISNSFPYILPAYGLLIIILKSQEKDA